MLFQKLLCDRLSTFSELHNLPTSQQSCARPHRQPLDTVYTLIIYIQHNHDIHKTPTYIFFGDLQTAFPSTFKQQLLIRLAHYGITGQLWQQLRVLHLHHKIRVLHGHIPSSSFVNIEKGLPEGGRLSPLE